MTLDEILNAVTENGDAMIVSPASAADLRTCQKNMAAISMPPVPPGYAAFLRTLNGFAWNGIEFCGTDQITGMETDYTLNDIVSANEDFAAYNEDFRHCVFLGRADDDLYVYNTESGHYEVLDISGRDVMEDFETFDAMFADVVLPRI